jgi:predicted anti-sigma-YlaC factor YlaD
MRCEELLALLNEYVDGELDPSLCTGLEEHLRECEPCRVVVDTLRGTVTLYKGDEPYELPPEFHERLHRVLQERWRKKFGAV